MQFFVLLSAQKRMLCVSTVLNHKMPKVAEFDRLAIWNSYFVSIHCNGKGSTQCCLFASLYFFEMEYARKRFCVCSVSSSEIYIWHAWGFFCCSIHPLSQNPEGTKQRTTLRICVGMQGRIGSFVLGDMMQGSLEERGPHHNSFGLKSLSRSKKVLLLSQFVLLSVFKEL